MRQSVRQRETASERYTVRFKPSELAVLRAASERTGEPISIMVVNGALREAARLQRLPSEPAGTEPSGGG